MGNKHAALITHARSTQELIFWLILKKHKFDIIRDSSDEMKNNPYFKYLLDLNLDCHPNGQSFTLGELATHFGALQFILVPIVVKTGVTPDIDVAERLLFKFITEINDARNPPAMKIWNAK